MSAPVLLEIRDLKTWFPIRTGVFRQVVGHVRAVDGVTLAIRRGETLALVGESGCGKTTVGKTIVRLVSPAAGQVFYGGQEILSLSVDGFQPLRRRIQMVFQDPYGSLDPRMPVGSIVEEGLAACGDGLSRAERRDRVAQTLRNVGIEASLMGHYPHEFSGGQRQRVSISRALVADPEFLILDEPVSALDVSIQAQILNLLESLQSDLGLTYLFITHDLSVVEYLADRVAVMYLGQIVEEGPAERIFDQPLHPYTRALLASAPRPDRDGPREAAALGEIPSASKPPPGCRFHPRCPEALGRCRTDVPAETEGEGRRVLCHLYPPLPAAGAPGAP